MLSKRTKIKVSELVIREEDMLVLDVNSGSVYKINETALYLIKLLKDGPSNIEKLSRSLARKYKIPISQAINDVRHFVEVMNQNGQVIIKTN